MCLTTRATILAMPTQSRLAYIEPALPQDIENDVTLKRRIFQSFAQSNPVIVWQRFKNLLRLAP
jgi:hypothetical protein